MTFSAVDSTSDPCNVWFSRCQRGMTHLDGQVMGGGSFVKQSCCCDKGDLCHNNSNLEPQANGCKQDKQLCVSRSSA